MKELISFSKSAEHLLKRIVQSPKLHLKWLNTLSYMENCGARKIAACEHPTQVKEEMLKHAAEEFRHAHYLKRQMQKISDCSPTDYALDTLLGGTATLQYIKALDLKACRYLKKVVGCSKKEIRAAAYLLVTYAIELRAKEMYPLYDQILRQAASKVTVKSILLEEMEHLNEMQRELNAHPMGMAHVGQICMYEGELCRRWIKQIEAQISMEPSV